jgi:hypothetical protein
VRLQALLVVAASTMRATARPDEAVGVRTEEPLTAPEEGAVKLIVCGMRPAAMVCWAWEAAA